MYTIHNYGSILPVLLLCRTAGIFRGRKLRKLVKITIFAKKTLADCLLLPCQKMPRPHILQRELLRIATNGEIRKSFPLYGKAKLKVRDEEFQ